MVLPFEGFRGVSGIEFAAKIKASMERQRIPCPSFKWSDLNEGASFQTQELEQWQYWDFINAFCFFTPENVDTLEFLRKDEEGHYHHKSEQELFDEVTGTKKVESAPIQEQPTQNDDVFQLDLAEILAARQQLAKASTPEPSRELVAVGASEQPAESQVIAHRRSVYQERRDRRADAAAAGIIRHRKLSEGYYNRSHSMTRHKESMGFLVTPSLKRGAEKRRKWL